jgi:hypothetical protein
MEKNNTYQNGKIYTIRSHSYDGYYIGATCQPLYKRLHQHQSNYKNLPNRIMKKNKVSRCSSYDIICCGDAYIELLENYPCKDKNELEKREGELIREHSKTNKIVNIMKKIDHEIDDTVMCGCGSSYKKKNEIKHCKLVKHVFYEDFGHPYICKNKRNIISKELCIKECETPIQ